MLTTNLIALLLYAIASGYLLLHIYRQHKTPTTTLLLLTATGVCFHAVGVFLQLNTNNGIDMSIQKVGSLIACSINVIVLLSCLRKPLHSLFILLLPLSIIVILTALALQPSKIILSNVNIGLAAHILLSIVAYSLIAMASIQALLWNWQNKQLRRHQFRGLARMLPPLQTMESLVFNLLWAGQILLTLGILIGITTIDDIFAQKLVHKTVLSLFAWCIFAALLWGRHTAGWRGKVATRWVLTGFGLLMLAYFGSKLVIEILLR